MSVLEKTVGRIELGAGLAILLYGITILQTHLYFQTHVRQPLVHRLFVLWVWLLDTIHSALCIGTVYGLVVTDYTTPSRLDYIEWNQMTLLMLGIISAATAHIYYTARFCLAARRSLLTIFSTTVAVLQFVFASIGTLPILYERIGSRWSILSSQNSTLAVTGLTITFGLLSDALLIGSCKRYLLPTTQKHISIHTRIPIRHPSTRHERENITEPTLHRYALWALAVNVVLSALAILLFAALPHDTMFLGVMIVQSKLYANSLIAYMHSRRVKADEQIPSAPPSQPLRFRHSFTDQVYSVECGMDTFQLTVNVKALPQTSTYDSSVYPLDTIGESSSCKHTDSFFSSDGTVKGHRSII